MITLVLRSHKDFTKNFKDLKKTLKNLKLNNLEIKIHNGFSDKVKFTHFTLLKSPHVNKKARVQYSLIPNQIFFVTMSYWILVNICVNDFFYCRNNLQDFIINLNKSIFLIDSRLVARTLLSYNKFCRRGFFFVSIQVRLKIIFTIFNGTKIYF